MKEHSNLQNRDFVTDFFENFSIKLLLYITRKSILFILIFTILAFLLPFLYIRYSTPIYSTTASLIKKKTADNSFMFESSNNLIKNDGEEKLNRDIQILKSEALLKNVTDSFNLNIEYYKLGRISRNRMELYGYYPFTISNNLKITNPELFSTDVYISISKNHYSLTYEVNGNAIKINDLKSGVPFENKDISILLTIVEKNINDKFAVKFKNKNQIIAYIQKNVSINHDNNNVYLSIKNTNTKKSEFILNKLIENFLNYDKKENSEKIESSLVYIQNQLDTFNKEYDISQNKKFNLARQTNTYNPEAQISNNLNILIENEKKIDELKFVVNKLENFKKSLSTNNPSPENSFTGNSLFTEENDANSIQLLILNRNKLLLDYKSNHPLVKAINQQLEDRINTISYQTRIKVKENELLIQTLRGKINNSKSELNSNTELSSEFSKMEKEALMKEKFISDLQEKKNQFQVLKSSIVSDYIILDSPRSSLEPLSPKKNFVYIFSFILFLLATLILILYRYISFDKIVSLNNLTKDTNVPILGVIPFVENAMDLNEKNSSSPRSKIVVLENTKSRVAEAFKKIRANMKYLDENHYKVVATTSTVSGEGKTFVLINLAMVHAILDKKVVLVDLDLRKPRIAKSFNLDNSIGMSKILSNNASIEESIQKLDGISNLDIITSGPIPPNPSELILSSKFNEFLEILKSKYDYIFIDTPPLGIVNESIEIINKVDIPLYIVRSNYSKRAFIDNINEVYNNKQNKNLYIIFNHFGDGASSYVNYGYGYGYGTSYGSNYGEEFKAKHEGYYSEKNTIVKKNWVKRIFNWKL